MPQIKSGTRLSLQFCIRLLALGVLFLRLLVRFFSPVETWFISTSTPRPRHFLEFATEHVYGDSQPKHLQSLATYFDFSQ